MSFPADFRLRRRDVVLGGVAIVLTQAVAPLAWAQSSRIAFSNAPQQGGLLVGRVAAGTQVWVNAKPVRVADGAFCFGFGRDETKAIPVRAVFADGTSETLDITPSRREFPTQRINGLPEQYVSPPPEVSARIARDARAVGEARVHDTNELWFAETLDWPVPGPLSGLYGSQRILNGEPREPHYGIDIAAPANTPIKAPTDAIVRLAEDLFLSGNTMVLDHGHGVSTSYLHMTRFNVKNGDRVRRGDVIGFVGATGRATGPHLCWRMNWFQTRLDAALSASRRADKI